MAPGIGLDVPPGSVVRAIVPLEFKTGRAHVSHNAQVSLYLLMLTEKYRDSINMGLLW